MIISYLLNLEFNYKNIFKCIFSRGSEFEKYIAVEEVEKNFETIKSILKCIIINQLNGPL